MENNDRYYKDSGLKEADNKVPLWLIGLYAFMLVSVGIYVILYI